jgi:hypothetical protein
VTDDEKTVGLDVKVFRNIPFIPLLITVPFGGDGQLQVEPHILSFKVYGPGHKVLASGDHVTADEALKILNDVHPGGGIG